MRSPAAIELEGLKHTSVFETVLEKRERGRDRKRPAGSLINDLNGHHWDRLKPSARSFTQSSMWLSRAQTLGTSLTVFHVVSKQLRLWLKLEVAKSIRASHTRKKDAIIEPFF